MASNSIKTSARKFERIARRIVRIDVESQTTENGFEEQFFIDKFVYDRHLSDMIETMEDSSLSNFFLKYDLSIHTTELIRYFSPLSSTKRDFVSLKYLSGQYGYHLCYMALREAARANDARQEITDIVKAMEQTAIAHKIKPPSDLYQDSLQFSLSSSSPIVSDDVPSGQGESRREDNVANLKSQQALRTHINPESLADALQDIRPVPMRNEDKRHAVALRRQISGRHLPNCQCFVCNQTLEEPSGEDQAEGGQQQTRREGRGGQTGEREQNDTPQSQFSGVHLGNCNCFTCQNARGDLMSHSKAVQESGEDKAEFIPLMNTTERYELTDHEQLMDNNEGSSTDDGSLTPSTAINQLELDIKSTLQDNNDSKPSKAVSAQLSMSTREDEGSVDTVLHRTFSAIHLGNCNCAMCNIHKQRQEHIHDSDEWTHPKLATPTRSSTSTIFEGIQESLILEYDNNNNNDDDTIQQQPISYPGEPVFPITSDNNNNTSIMYPSPHEQYDSHSRYRRGLTTSSDPAPVDSGVPSSIATSLAN